MVEGLRVDHDVGILRVLEGDDFELQLLPLVADALEDCFVLGLSVGMLDDLVDVVLVVLNIVFSQFDDRELVLSLQVRCLNQVEYLHPVAVTERVFPQIFDELDDDVGLLDLLSDGLADRTTLPLDELVLRELVIEVLHHFMNRLYNHLRIKIEEWRIVAHLASLLPVEKDLPQPDGVLVDFLEGLEIFGARQLVLGHFLFRILIVLVEKLQELSIQDYLGPDFVNSFRPLEELLESVTAVLQPRLVMQVRLNILLLKCLDLLREHV